MPLRWHSIPFCHAVAACLVLTGVECGGERLVDEEIVSLGQGWMVQGEKEFIHFPCKHASLVFGTSTIFMSKTHPKSPE